MKVDSPVPGANCSCQVSSLSWRLASTFFNTAKARLRGFSSIERKKWPLVLLHGNGSMIEDFQSSGLIDLAAKKYRVIAVDRPGFGHSDRPRSTIWTPEAQADLIAAALKKISVQRAIVLGHSWGTLVALALAVKYPQEVEALVLASGYYYPNARADVVILSPPAIPVIGDLLSHTLSPLLSRLM